jgi:hypothetical protein
LPVRAAPSGLIASERRVSKHARRIARCIGMMHQA